MKPSGKFELARTIAEQLHRLIDVQHQQGNLLEHNLEKGLGNEEVLRRLLISFLPRKIGVAKGKIANAEGEMSKHLDVIVYDALNCPTLFIDEHRNQILPIEGIYSVIQVKTTLTNTALRQSFENLASVYSLQPRKNCSLNDHVVYCPPQLLVFAFSTDRSFDAIASQFTALSSEFPVTASAYSYSKKSPGYAGHTRDRHLVSSVNILGQGSVHHMLDGTIRISDYGKYTLGMFLTRVLNTSLELKLPSWPIERYLNWIMVQQWHGEVTILEG